MKTIIEADVPYGESVSSVRTPNSFCAFRILDNPPAGHAVAESENATYICKEHGRQPAVSVPPVIRFLLGEGPLDGCEYGDGAKPENEQGYFWWRKELRKLFPAPAAPTQAEGEK